MFRNAEARLTLNTFTVSEQFRRKVIIPADQLHRMSGSAANLVEVSWIIYKSGLLIDLPGLFIGKLYAFTLV